MIKTDDLIYHTGKARSFAIVLVKLEMYRCDFDAVNAQRFYAKSGVGGPLELVRVGRVGLAV